MLERLGEGDETASMVVPLAAEKADSTRAAGRSSVAGPKFPGPPRERADSPSST